MVNGSFHFCYGFDGLYWTGGGGTLTGGGSFTGTLGAGFTPFPKSLELTYLELPLGNTYPMMSSRLHYPPVYR
jgi:hypothetical protein